MAKKSGWARETVDIAELERIIRRHRGADSAIRAKDLVNLLGLGLHDNYPDRTIREAVNELIDLGVPVGSTVRSGPSGGGYFLVMTEEELQECVANYRARARENLRKADQLMAAFRTGIKQPALF